MEPALDTVQNSIMTRIDPRHRAPGSRGPCILFWIASRSWAGWPPEQASWTSSELLLSFSKSPHPTPSVQTRTPSWILPNSPVPSVFGLQMLDCLPSVPVLEASRSERFHLSPSVCFLKILWLLGQGVFSPTFEQLQPSLFLYALTPITVHCSSLIRVSSVPQFLRSY